MMDLIGKPYVSGGGDGENSFDCGSLVRKITGLDVHLIPSFKQGERLKTAKAIEENKKYFMQVDKPIEKTIVLIGRGEHPSHVGVFINNGVLHAVENLGVVFTSLKTLQLNGFTNITFWEYKHDNSN